MKRIVFVRHHQPGCDAGPVGHAAHPRVDRYITAQGLNPQALLVFSVVVGFTGAIISLLISKPMAKWSTGAQVLDPNAPRNQREAWLLDTVHHWPTAPASAVPKSPSTKARRTPATGAFKNDSLVGIHRSAGKHDRRGSRRRAGSRSGSTSPTATWSR